MKSFSSYVVSFLVGLYPKSFKDILGEDMKQVMLEQLGEASSPKQALAGMVKESVVEIPKAYIHSMKRNNEEYTIDNGLFVKRSKKDPDPVHQEKGKLAVVFCLILGGLLACIMFMRAHGFVSNWWLLGVLVSFVVVGGLYRKVLPIRDILVYGTASFLITHFIVLSFFVQMLSKEFTETFVSYPQTKEALLYSKTDDDGNLVEDGIWKEDEDGMWVPVDKEMWCAKNETGREVLKSENLNPQGTARKGVEALLAQAHLATAWVQGCMSDEAYLNEHHELARIAWVTDPHFDWSKMDYTPIYQLMEAADYIIAPRLFMRGIKLCPILVHRVFPELRGDKNDPSPEYCAGHFEERYQFKDYSYVPNNLTLALGLDRKNMDQAKKEILAHKAMTTDDIKDIEQQIKSDKKIIFELLEQNKQKREQKDALKKTTIE